MEERTCILEATLEQGFSLDVVGEFFRLFGSQRIYIAKKLKQEHKSLRAYITTSNNTKDECFLTWVEGE